MELCKKIIPLILSLCLLVSCKDSGEAKEIGISAVGNTDVESQIYEPNANEVPMKTDSSYTQKEERYHQFCRIVMETAETATVMENEVRWLAIPSKPEYDVIEMKRTVRMDYSAGASDDRESAKVTCREACVDEAGLDPELFFEIYGIQPENSTRLVSGDELDTQAYNFWTATRILTQYAPAYMESISVLNDETSIVYEIIYNPELLATVVEYQPLGFNYRAWAYVNPDGYLEKTVVEAYTIDEPDQVLSTSSTVFVY